MIYCKSIRTWVSAVIFSSLLFILPAGLQAQIGNVQSFIKAGKDDASLLVQEYLSPLASGLGADLNSGWNVSGGAIHPLGFKVQLRGAVATVPTADRSFSISSNELQAIEPSAGTEVTSPTISGDNQTGPSMESKQKLPNGDPLYQFNLPQGLGVNYVPAPMIQANVGLPKNIEIVGRIIPETSLRLPVVGDKDYGDFKMFGLGAKHELNNYIPGGDVFPLTFSLMAGFNNIKMTSDLNLDPPEGPNTAEDPNYTGNYNNQKITAEVNNFTVNLLAGKDLPIISVYGGVGYETATMNVDISGDYPIVVPNDEFPNNSNKPKRIDTIMDPVSYSEDGANTFHALVGGSISLLFFDIMVEATLAEYTTVNAGIGIGF